MTRPRMTGRTPRAGSSSAYRGVGWHSGNRMWRARIAVDGRRIELGYFAIEVMAAMAYDDAARQVHGPSARLNFPRPGEAPARTRRH